MGGKVSGENAPADPYARPQCLPSLLPEEELRELGRAEVVYGCEADCGDEEGMEMVREV